MQFNPKLHVNLKDLVEGIVDRINKTAEENKLQKLYEIRIKDGTYKGNTRLKEGNKPKPFKSIIFVVNDLDTREQVVLFSADYTIKNSSELLTSNYKKALYKELLYSCLLSFGIIAENTVKQQRVETALKIAEQREHPATPDEAFQKDEDIVNNM